LATLIGDSTTSLGAKILQGAVDIQNAAHRADQGVYSDLPKRVAAAPDDPESLLEQLKQGGFWSKS
jgi:hypothetical protein